jgi:hypothetical protein
MWNTKIKVFLIMTLATSTFWGQDGLSFFHAKSEIVIERNGEKQDFTAHIRYNLKDTLWVSFTGAFGIEGARMLVTKDSTYIINKIEKTNMAFSVYEENYLIPYAFSLEDWKVLLLNIPAIQDSNAEVIMENEIQITTQFSNHKIQKTFQKNNRILKCQFNNTRGGALCEVIYSQYDNSTKTWNLAKERQIQINQAASDPIKISIRYLDFVFNQPKPFNFNYSKYKDGINQ